MPIELRILGWTVILGLVYVLAAAAFGTWERGLPWNVGNRDGASPPLGKYAARAERACRNFLETFAFFAVAVLAVLLAHRNGAQTAIGAQIYLWARVAYLPVYIIGIPYLRTLIWVASLWGILQMLEALLLH
jgi:uncharacterized MAPEG superfamily protein